MIESIHCSEGLSVSTSDRNNDNTVEKDAIHYEHLFPQIVFHGRNHSDVGTQSRSGSVSGASDDGFQSAAASIVSGFTDSAQPSPSRPSRSNSIVSLCIDTSAEKIVKEIRYTQSFSERMLEDFIAQQQGASYGAGCFLPDIFCRRRRRKEVIDRSDNTGRAMLTVSMCTYHRSRSVAQSVSEDRMALASTNPKALLGWQILLLNGSKSYLDVAVVTGVRQNHGVTEYRISGKPFPDLWVKLKRNALEDGVTFLPTRHVLQGLDE